MKIHKPFKPYTALFVLGLATASSIPKAEEAVQDLNAIRNAVENFLSSEVRAPERGQVVIQVNDLDPRLRLTACESDPIPYPPSSNRLAGKTTIEVTCPGPKSWTLHVPVRITLLQKVAIAEQYVKRGERIRPEDIRFEERDISELHRGYFTETESPEGYLAISTISKGRVFLPPQLERKDQIKRGDLVSIVASTGQIEVRMKGKAMKNGSIGDNIEVQNLSSSRVVSARVVAPGTVKVGI